MNINYLPAPPMYLLLLLLLSATSQAIFRGPSEPEDSFTAAQKEESGRVVAQYLSTPHELLRGVVERLCNDGNKGCEHKSHQISVNDYEE